MTVREITLQPSSLHLIAHRCHQKWNNSFEARGIMYIVRNNRRPGEGIAKFIREVRGK
jgi:hypothetical protein